MKQDIRDLFRDTEADTSEASGKPLPENHRQEFYDKLKASRPRRTSKLNTSYLFKIAAIMMLFIAFTFLMFNKTEEANNQIVKEVPIETQIDAIEKEYLASIDMEWHSFIAITQDDILVERFRKKLKELDIKYKDISVAFKTDNENILVVDALVENLQNRLQILKDIQKHIKILNQKNEKNENTL